ncbi:MAG: HAD family hydrolase [Ruminococcaceae bacterium]|nr:HAD family hydrolase [Oscillospiraceae bacterium]
MDLIDLRATEGIPQGLSSEEVAKLRAEGKVNISDERVGKSYGKIVRDNLFTYFNLIWLVVTVLLILCDSFTNMTFLAIVIPNIVISIIQEMKAKRTVEKLSVTTEPKATVMRDGSLVDIDAADIVLGDIMLVEMGRQVLSDAVVISGFAEANESMLTGESDAIKKNVGDQLLAGSFLVGGSVYARVINVGRDNYIHKIEKAAKSFKAPTSNLFHDLNKLIKSIGMFLIPMSIVLFITNWISLNDSYDEPFIQAILNTCGSIVGMIPSGVYLLVTLTLTLSVITLARKKTLVQDMYSIEMLASADVVCLDKTGTITDGTMKVTHVESLDGTDISEIERIMSHIEGSEQSVNNTSAALIDRFGKDVSVKIIKKIPFSSARKYSAVSIVGLGAFSIGAPHFVPCPISAQLDAMVSERAKEGERVLILVRHPDDELESEGQAIALIAISDRIRPAAKETIANFQEQGVTLKVISGDHAETVSTIAAKVGINNADKYISCDKITDEELVESAEKYAVFGRVTPEQKVLLIKTLRINGHTVAMTGDGVNDTLALKESNCAIAMADGSEMARKVSHIVLMNSDFATLPDVVREGRRCINNVRQSSVLYLMKTIFTIILSIISAVTLSGYPFEPRNFLLLELFVIGIASVLLAIEPNNKRIEGNYLDTVIIRSFPNALAMLAPVIILMIAEKFIPADVLGKTVRNSISMAVIILVAFINLVALCRPFTKWRAAVVSAIGACIAIAIPVSVYFLDDMLGFGLIVHSGANGAADPVILTVFAITMAIGAAFAILMQVFRGKIEKIIAKNIQKKNEREAKLREENGNI